jgi:hypothetical protein
MGNRRSTADDLDTPGEPAASREQPSKVHWVARVQHLRAVRGYQRDVRVADVGSARPAAQLPHLASHGVERRDHAMLQRSRKLGLRLGRSPDLCQSSARDENIRVRRRGQFQHGPHVSLGALERDQRTRVEDDPIHFRARLRCLRAAAATSAGVSSPCSASHSRTTRSKPCARSFRAAASASHDESGSRPAAFRTSRASFESSEMARRATVILRYYASGIGGQAARGRCTERPQTR